MADCDANPIVPAPSISSSGDTGINHMGLCRCDDGAPTAKVVERFVTTDGGVTWVSDGYFTDVTFTVVYVPVGTVVNCDSNGVAATGNRARRTIVSAGTTLTIPTGLPLVGELVTYVEWESNGAAGSIVDSAAQSTAFVAGQSGAWTHNWTAGDTTDIVVTAGPGDVSVSWSEVYV